jgi:hypothetical protein
MAICCHHRPIMPLAATIAAISCSDLEDRPYHIPGMIAARPSLVCRMVRVVRCQPGELAYLASRRRQRL